LKNTKKSTSALSIHCQFYRSNRTLDIFFFMKALIPITSQKVPSFFQCTSIRITRALEHSICLYPYFKNYLLSKKDFLTYFLFYIHIFSDYVKWTFLFFFLSSYCYTLANCYFIFYCSARIEFLFYFIFENTFNTANSD